MSVRLYYSPSGRATMGIGRQRRKWAVIQKRGAARAPRGEGSRGYFFREGLEGAEGVAGASWVLGWMASITGVAMKTEA